MDLINREQALGCFWNYANDDGAGYGETEMPAYDRLQALPYIEADIIFCKDCVHFREHFGRTECVVLDRIVDEDADFCSWAERRQE